MVDVKSVTLFLYFIVVELCLIIGDQDLRNPKSANDVFP
jgi:hypothetical protein